MKIRCQVNEMIVLLSALDRANYQGLKLTEHVL